MTENQLTVSTLLRVLRQVRELCDLASGHPDVLGTRGEAIPRAAVALIDETLDEAEGGD